MKFIKSQEIFFDDVKEEKRINSCFTGKTRTELLNILNLFREEKYQECLDEINALDYDSEYECSKKEYVCEFISDFMWDLTHGYKYSKIG